jgi:uncharacterized protein (DUF58 family)
MDTRERRQIALFVAAIVGVFAIVWGEISIILWSAAVATLAIAAGAWAKRAWRALDVEVAFVPPRAFVGEDVSLRITLSNRKQLPLPIVRVLARFPEGILSEREASPTALRGHRRRLSMPGRTELTLTLPVIAPTRGEYFFEPVEIEISDPFDLAPVRKSIEMERPLLVMPSPSVGIPLRILRRLPFGSPSAGARLFEDREHFAGVRDYERGDPLHHVHWKASAHLGRIQTKRYEPTRSAEVLFAVDVSNGEPFWYAVDPDTAEESIGWASYLARQALHAGWITGLVANTHLKRGRGPLRVPPAASVGAELALFAALARMPNQPTNDLAPVLREVTRRVGRRLTVIVVSPRPGPALVHEMAALRRRGCDVIHLAPPSRLEEAAS